MKLVESKLRRGASGRGALLLLLRLQAAEKIGDALYSAKFRRFVSLAIKRKG
jgi:hypothetical protein